MDDYIQPMNDYLAVPHDPGFSKGEMDQILMYHGTRQQRKAARARFKERERKRSLMRQLSVPQDSPPPELEESRATELGVTSGRRRKRIIWWRSAP